MSSPETPAEGAAEPAPVDPRAHVIVATGGLSGRVGENVVYGPYPSERAHEVAEQLNEGDWMGRYWDAVPIGRLPGELPPPINRDLSRLIGHPFDDPDLKPIFEVLERRQGDDHADA